MNDDSPEEVKQLLFQSCKDGSLATVQQLLTQHESLGVQIDSLKDDNGNTALSIASENGHSNVVKLLLDKGSQVDIMNTDGWTALMKASQSGYKDVVKLLLKHGAQVNLQSRDGCSALLLASEAGYIEIVKKLLKYGGQADLKDSMGRSAITVARNSEIILTFTADVQSEIGNFKDIPQNDPLQDEPLDEKEHLTAIKNAQ